MLCLFIVGVSSASYSVEEDIVLINNADNQITKWKDNMAGVISMTFDDGYAAHYSIGVPALNELGFKGTFFVSTGFNPSATPNWDDLRSTASMGHEIGSHTKTHPDLTSLTVAQMQDEILGSQTMINSQITSQRCITFSYPFGILNNDVEGIVKSAYVAARGVRWGLNSLPFDIYNAYTGFPDRADSLGITLESQVNLAEQSGQWLVVGFHGLDGTGYGPVTEARFRQFLQYVRTKNLWVGTFGSVAKYIRERESAILSVVSSSSDGLVLSLIDSLNDVTYDEALTIRSEVPSSCNSALIVQGSSVMTVNSILEGTTKVIYYDAMPDRGNITITYNPANKAAVASKGSYSTAENTSL